MITIVPNATETPIKQIWIKPELNVLEVGEETLGGIVFPSSHDATHYS